MLNNQKTPEVTKFMGKEKSLSVPETRQNPWLLILVVIVLLTIFSFGVVGCVVLFISSDGLETGNVAVIPVKGIILGDKGTDLFATGYTVSSAVVEQIEKAEKDPAIKAIIIEINSPGGSAVASAEIARVLQETNKPVVAVIREVGASGAYWVASAADHVIAHEVSITGSIGVFASYLQYGALLTRFNVSYERFVAGEHKDMASPYREMTSEEKELYQQTIDAMHTVFIREVANARNLNYETVEALATGQIYLGVQALDLGLVDQLGGKQEAYAYLNQTLGIEVIPVEYETEKSFLELLASVFQDSAFSVGTGIGAVLVEKGKYSPMLL